jgi:endonuclease/exonuclease/phosphatase family metal-dependent hydrolase
MKQAFYWITHPLKRKWIIGLVPPVAALVAGLVAGATTDALADPPKRMKVMSWNIHASQGNFDGWVDTIGKLQPALAGLNEVCESDLNGVLKAVEEKYGVRYDVEFKRWDGKVYCGIDNDYGNALISIYSLTDVESHKYKKVDDEDRGFTVASINAPGISKIRVYVTHLGLRGVQEEEAKQLAAFHKRDSAKHEGSGTLMFGDFNAEPHHPSMEPLWDAGLKDADPNCGKKSNTECKITYPDKEKEKPDKKKIDYIWYKGLNASDHHVSTTNHSDHWIPQANIRP